MNHETERSALRISLIGASLFAIVGLSFAVITRSQAILLDGAFNLISAIMAFLATRVAALVSKPDTVQRPLGYIALEPFYVLIKGGILAVLTIVVVISNIILAFQGGSELELGIVVVYICAVVIGNAIVYFLIKQKEKKSSSPLIAIERENWMINTLISSAIAVSFLLVFFLKDGALSPVVPYVDQIVVILVGLVSLPIPIKAVRQGLRELLLLGPDSTLYNSVKMCVDRALPDNEIANHLTYVLKMGRKLIVTIYIEPVAEQVNSSISDTISEAVRKNLQADYPNIVVDVVLTENMKESLPE